MGGWRNWQTRTAQDRVAERPYGFKSLPAQFLKAVRLKRIAFLLGGAAFVYNFIYKGIRVSGIFKPPPGWRWALYTKGGGGAPNEKSISMCDFCAM